MRKALFFVFIVLTAAMLLAGCGSSAGEVGTDVSLSRIAEEMAAARNDPAAVMLDAKYTGMLFGTDMTLVRESAAFMITRTVSSEETVLLRAADESGRDALKEQLQAHLDSYREQTKNYDPDGFAMASKCEVKTQDLYVWLIVSPEREALEKIFSAHRKSYAQGEAPVYLTPAPTQTPAPTDTPAPELTPQIETTPEPTPLPFGMVPASERVEDSWFDDALFVGDSIVMNLRDYAMARRMRGEENNLGEAQFLCRDGLSYQDSSHNESRSPDINGKAYNTIEEAIAASGAKKIYLSMGSADMISSFGVEHTAENAALLIAHIREAVPDAVIILSAETPRIQIYDNHVFNNAQIQELNALLLRCAEENGCWFVDSYEGLAQGTDCMPMEYSETANYGIHLNEKGCTAWVDYLYTHTP
ncbi:MAG: DUF4358 domain-containing protein [Oscillospiraceae bacterium]|nr:DUF4358 domain-containing protein [Oscillospiraceae bacterium]